MNNNTNSAGKKTSARKLVLNRETVKRLAPSELDNVRGGLFQTLLCTITHACTIVTTGGSYNFDCFSQEPCI